MAEHRPDYYNLDSISLLCAECEGYWPCRYAGSDARAVTSGDAGAPGASHATVGQASRSGSGGVTPGDESS